MKYGIQGQCTCPELVIRNAEEEIIMAFVVTVNFRSNNLPETVVASYGVELCRNLSLTGIDLELDSQVITRMLLNRTSNNFKLKSKIDKVLEDLSCIYERQYQTLL